MTPEQEHEVARCIFREANDAFVVVRPPSGSETALRIVEVNPAVQRLTGRRRRELLSMELAEILAGDQAPELADIVRACQSTSQHLASDGYEILVADGTRRQAHVSVSRIHVDPEPLGLIVIRDISRLKQVEEERLRLVAHLQQAQKLESLAVFAGGVAHDFNNLLTAILGYSSLALLDLPEGNVLTPKLQPLLQEVERATRRAADLTRQLLAYAGKTHLREQELDLSAVVRDTVPLIQPLLSRLARLQLNLVGGLPRVSGDATHIAQAITNLVLNASDALGERAGAIAVRTGVEEVTNPVPLVAAQDVSARPGHYVFVEVRDEGSGLDDDTRLRIFDPFYSTKRPGRGLGLAVVHGVMRAHRGLIQVNSALGRGSTFRLFFPPREGPSR